MKNNNGGNVKVGDLVRHKNGGFYSLFGIGVIYKIDGVWAQVYFLNRKNDRIYFMSEAFRKILGT